MILRNCAECGAEFKVWPYQLAQGRGRFCSRPCGYKQIGQTLSRRAHAARPMIQSMHDYWLLPTNGDGWTKVSNEDIDYLAQFVWHKDGHGYPKATIDGNPSFIHRVVMERALGRKLLESEFVDHIHHDILDNRRCQLRVADPVESAANRRRAERNKSGYKGVSWCGQTGKWRMVVGGKAITGGQIYSKRSSDAAYLANLYDQYASQIYGEFAALNFHYVEVPRQD